MKNESYYMDKLKAMAEEFNRLYLTKEWGRANWIYIKAHVVAIFLELPQDDLRLLFGQQEDDGTDDPAPSDELFNWDKVRKVGWHCCIKQHKTYQDVSNRRLGIPDDVQWYSDPEYCELKCRKQVTAQDVQYMQTLLE